jgi:hypothetical protein
MVAGLKQLGVSHDKKFWGKKKLPNSNLVAATTISDDWNHITARQAHKILASSFLLSKMQDRYPKEKE